MIAPLVMGLTYNGYRASVAELTVRLRGTFPVDATRVRLSLAPGLQDAEELVLPTTGVALTGAVIGRAGESGVITEILHEWGPQDLSSGVWLSEWVDLPLLAGEAFTVSFGYTNPQELPLAGGTMGAWKTFAAGDFNRVGGAAWTRDPMVRGPMSPALIYDTPGTPVTVAVIGDSNAAGRGATLPFHEAYAHVAARATGQVVIPLGYSGETTSDYDLVSPKWTRVLGLAGLAHVDAVVIASGINDLGIGRTAALTLSNLDRVVTRARAITGGPVHVATLPPASWTGATETARQAYNEALRAGGHGDGVIDLDAVLRSTSAPSQIAAEYAGTDAIHYGTAGHAAASGALVPLIESLTPDVPSLGVVARAALPVGTVIFREPVRGRRVALRNPANGLYLGQALWSGGTTPPPPLDPSWADSVISTPGAWAELAEEPML